MELEMLKQHKNNFFISMLANIIDAFSSKDMRKSHTGSSKIFQKSFNKPFEFLLYKTNRVHFSMCA